MDLLVNSIIKREDADDGGLIGGWFCLEQGGEVFGISCNHVIANINSCQAGDVLTDADGTVIGSLSRWVRLLPSTNLFVNKSEFALFRPADGIKPGWSARPTGFATSSIGKSVQFDSGSFHSVGTITRIARKVSVSWKTGNYRFTCVEITSSNRAPFSRPGHSGGAVLSDGQLLGIILGVSEDGLKTYVIPFAGSILNLVDLMIL